MVRKPGEGHLVSGRKWKNDVLILALFQHGQWYPLPSCQRSGAYLIQQQCFEHLYQSYAGHLAGGGGVEAIRQNSI